MSARRPAPVRAAARTYHRLRGAQVAPGARVPVRSRLSSRTRIGTNTWINGRATCKGGAAISIGPHCAIGQELLVTTTNHDTRHANLMLRTHWEHGFADLDRSAEVVIGPACWIGDRVTVLGGARVGAGTVIAAGSVVARGDYPAYAILAGVPARVVRMRAEPETVSALVAARWWEWPAERVARNRAFFEADITVADAASLQALIAG